MKTLILSAVLLFPATGFADTIFLPNPAGSSVAAGWIPTNAEIVGGELTFDGPWPSTWSASTEVPASFTDGAANWTLTSSFTGSNATGSNAIYTFTRTNTTFTAETTDYDGFALGKVVLQLTPNSDNDRDLQLDASLRIGGVTYTAAQAAFTSDRSFGGDLNDPANRYYGHFGGLALATYEWDLDALGYTGSYSNISLSWILPQTHTSLYDAQISFVAVPEPSTCWALAVAAGFVAIRVARRRTHA